MHVLRCRYSDKHRKRYMFGSSREEAHPGLVRQVGLVDGRAWEQRRRRLLLRHLLRQPVAAAVAAASGPLATRGAPHQLLLLRRRLAGGVQPRVVALLRRVPEDVVRLNLPLRAFNGKDAGLSACNPISDRCV